MALSEAPASAVVTDAPTPAIADAPPPPASAPKTELMTAAEQGALEQVAALLAGPGCDAQALNQKDEHSNTALTYAGSYLYDEIVAVLLANGADVAGERPHESRGEGSYVGPSVMMWAARNGDEAARARTVELLATHGAAKPTEAQMELETKAMMELEGS